MKKSLCPECDLELREFRLGSVDLDFCEECHGLWFDREELLRTSQGVHLGTKEIPPMFHKPVKEIISRERPCVECRISMEIIDYEGVEVDICPTCKGIWLDAQELPQLIRRFYTKVTTKKEKLLPAELAMAGELLTLDYLVDRLKTDKDSISEFGKEILKELGPDVGLNLLEVGAEIGLESLAEADVEAGFEVGAEVGAEIGAAILSFLLGLLS